MSIATFDTLKFTETLKEAGVSDRQARAEVIAISEAFGQTLDAQVATKADIYEVKDEIQEVKAELKDEIQEVKAELKDEIQEVKQDLVKLDAKIDTVAKELDTKIDKVDAKIDNVDARLSAKINLVHWMMGFNLALTTGILLILLQSK